MYEAIVERSRVAVLYRVQRATAHSDPSSHHPDHIV